ncbi:MAG: N5,N10-methylene tetrahydromethanopterin reductase [Dehalococcoidia bacterium]|nr:MAG: N5,N10-methylene tetrahydromethanopterin reductase [Dehalococcoidia bacterium]
MITRFGIAPLTGPFVDDYRLIAAAEEAGFESGWTNDGTVDGYVRLAAYTAHTKRMIFGTGAVIQPLRNPITHVGAARDLAEMSDGRVIIGVGSGVKGQLNTFYGIFGDQAEHPAPRMREFVQLFKLLTDPDRQGPVTFEGRFFKLAAGRARPWRQRIPIYVAAVNRHMLNVTGELADGLIGHPIYSYEYLKNVVVPTITAALDRAGRDRASFDFSSYILTSINEDRDLAKRDVAISLGFYLSPRAFDCIFDESGWEEEKVTVRQAFRSGNLENLATAVSERMLDSCTLYGTADEVRAKLTRYDGLLDQVILYSPGHLVPKERQYANFSRIVQTFGR